MNEQRAYLTSKVFSMSDSDKGSGGKIKLGIALVSAGRQKVLVNLKRRARESYPDKVAFEQKPKEVRE